MKTGLKVPFRHIPNIFMLTGLAAGFGAMTLPSEVAAQRAMEEITVTATRREESLLDVPVSVSVVSGEQIREQSLQNLDDLSNWVPGLSIREGGEQTGISIRGFGAGLNFGFDQSVGLFIDGMYSARERQFRGRFLDVESVEVLRGPQATLFGKNTISGAVIIRTGDPTHEPEVQFRGEVGGGANDRHQVEAVVNGSLTETIAGRLALRAASQDGYMENTLTGETEEQQDDWVVRSTFLWTPTDKLSARLKLEYSEFERSGRHFQVSDVGGPFSDDTTGLGPAAQLDIYRTYDPEFEFALNDRTSKQKETADVESTNVVLDVSYDLGWGEFESVTGLSSFDSQDDRDVDWSPTTYLFEPISQEFDQYSQEFRIVSNPGENFDFIAGLYFLGNEFYVDRRTDINIEVFLIPFGVSPGDDVIFGGPAENWRYAQLRFLDQDQDTQSAYFQGTWHLSDRLDLTAGLRYNREEKNADDRYFISEFGTDRFLTPNDAFLDLYAATGGTPDADQLAQMQTLAAGDPDAQKVANVCAGAASICPNLYDIMIANGRTGGGNLVETDWSPELTLSYDLNTTTMLYAKYSRGHKAGGFNAQAVGQDADPTFADETVDGYELGAKFRFANGYVNAALFRQDFDDLQTSVWTGNEFDVGNAGEARSQGLEVDGRWMITDRVQVDGSLIWLDARYLENSQNACSVPQLNFGAPGCFSEAGLAPADPGATGPFFQDLTGERFATQFQGNVGIGYARPVMNGLELLLRADATYFGDQENARDRTIEQPSKTLLDVSATLRQFDGPWSAAFLVKNATDKEHWWYEFEAPVQAGTRIGFYAPRRNYTLRLSYDLR